MRFVLPFLAACFIPYAACAQNAPAQPQTPVQKESVRRTVKPVSTGASTEKQILFETWWKRYTDVVVQELQNEASPIKQFAGLRSKPERQAFLEGKTDKEKNNLLLYAVLYTPFDVVTTVLPYVKDRSVLDQAFLISLSRYDFNTANVVKAFTQAGVNVNTKDYYSKVTPLMLAVVFGNTEADVEAVLDATSDLDAADDMGMSALTYAARYAVSPAFVDMLLDDGANMQITDRRGMTVLQHLRQNNFMPQNEAYQALRERLGEKKFVEKKPKTREFMESLLNGRYDEATKYLQTGVDINAKDAQGRTPLIHAILGKNPLEAAKFLIEEGANVNTADSTGVTPLLQALKTSKNPDLIALLIEAGANVNGADSYGSVPLKVAVLYGQPVETVRLLMNAGANANAKDQNGKTVKQYAAEKMNSGGGVDYGDMFKIEQKSQSQEKASSMTENLIKVLKTDDVGKISAFLTENKIDINARTTQGDTVLFLALKHTRNPEVVKSLLTAGANVRLRRTDSQTPLIYAVRNSAPFETVHMLIQAGASRTAKDNSGKTPADVLEENGDYSPEHYKLLKSFLTYRPSNNATTTYAGDFLTLIRNAEDADIRAALRSGANPNSQDANGNTPLLFLLQDPTEALLVKKMLSAGANPNLANYRYVLPLTYATERKQPEDVINVLIKSGAQRNKETETQYTYKCVKDDIYCLRKYKGKNKRKATKVDVTVKDPSPTELVTKESLVDDVYFLPPDVLQQVLEAKIDATGKNQDGKTPLMNAFTRLGLVAETVKQFIEAKVPVDDADNNGDTALFYAIRSNAPANVVEWLLKSGADPNHFNNSGKTPLAYALDKPEIFALLVDNGANINARDENGRVLLINCLNDPNFYKLIEAGADINTRDENGNTLLMNELMNEQYSPATVRMLLQNGADVNIQNHQGETALMLAAVMYKTSVGGKSDLIEQLLKAGAKIDAIDLSGKTALMHAVSETYNTPVILMLINAGADVGVRDDTFKSAQDYAKENSALKLENDYALIIRRLVPDEDALNEKLFEAVQARDVEMLKSLLSQGASPDATDYEGDSLLIKAVPFANGEAICDVLIRAKANLNTTNKDGDTALMKALIYKKNALALRLINAGADVNIANIKGETPLRRAFLYARNMPLIYALIKAGANVRSRDAFGKTALDYANEVPVLKSHKDYPALLTYLKKAQQR